VLCCCCVCSYRYASLYFCCAIEEQDNELITLEVIHRFVELLDKYFGSVGHTRRVKGYRRRIFTASGNLVDVCLFVQVCELDIIFNFEKAYFILDECLMGGEIQDTSKKSVLKAIEQADLLQEVTGRYPGGLNLSLIGRAQTLLHFMLLHHLSLKVSLFGRGNNHVVCSRPIGRYVDVTHFAVINLFYNM